jgi:hypothetical protein
MAKELDFGIHELTAPTHRSVDKLDAGIGRMEAPYLGNNADVGR